MTKEETILAYPTTIHELCDQLNGWCRKNSYPEMSADELLHVLLAEEPRDAVKISWVKGFLDAWGLACEAELRR